jgi:hypothetical protein
MAESPKSKDAAPKRYRFRVRAPDGQEIVSPVIALRPAAPKKSAAAAEKKPAASAKKA